MQPWEKYCEDIKSGRIASGNSIKKAVERFERFKQRDDIYFDSDEVEKCISFIGTMKHFLGKSAGTYFKLENWQTFILANIFGLKWKATGLRVCREVYIQVARKAGKDALAAAICLYLLIADGEASPEIVLASNSTDQSRIAFQYITKFGESIDPKKSILKPYRNSLKCPSNNGVIQVISSDPSKMDGKNLSAYIVDEYHEARDRKMSDVLASSTGMRTQSLGIYISTAGFSLTSPCYDLRNLGIEVLNGIKELDNAFYFIYELDDKDDWKNPKNFIKVQPNLGVTVTEEYMLQEVKRAEMDSTAVVGVLTKTFNKWLQSKMNWIPQTVIAGLMQRVKLEDYAGQNVVLGLDLGSVSDFSALSVLIPPQYDGGKLVFKTYCFLPERTLEGHPNQRLYEKFCGPEDCMRLTDGNVQDYTYIASVIREINNICPVAAIYLDKWNATQFQIEMTNQGYNVQEMSQSLGAFNSPTKEFERLAREGSIIIDKSALVLWSFGNVVIKTDWNGNCKPSKESTGGTSTTPRQASKIDPVISMLSALGGWLKDPISNDFNIYIL